MTARLFVSSVQKELAEERAGRLRTKPFDAAACPGATLADIDKGKLDLFLAAPGPSAPIRSAVERVILGACVAAPRSTPEPLGVLGYDTRTGNFEQAIARLLESGALELTVPDRPRSHNQHRRLTAQGQRLVACDGGRS